MRTLLWSGSAIAFVTVLGLGCFAQSEASKINLEPRPAGEAVDWPNWRGPDHNGISKESAWRKTFAEEGPKVLWKTNVGTGFSSVSVVDGRLYTMGHVGDDDIVYCFNANTGEEIWRDSYPCALVDNLHEGGPAATPTVHDGRVYTVSKEGHLNCYEATSGNKLWSQELQKLLGVEMPTWGFSCSPRVVGELLIVEAGRTCALNRESGELAWKTEAYRPGYGSPALMRRGDEDLVVVLNNDYLMVVRLSDGTEVAKHKWETDYATTSITPIVVDDTIFISTGYNRGCIRMKLVDDKLERMYQNKVMSNHMANCVLWEGHLYGFDGNSHNSRNVKLKCMDFETGKEKWSERGLGCGSLMMADGKLIALGDAGDLVIATASPEKFEPLAKAKVLEGRCWTVPVLSGGAIYCRNAAGDLVALEMRE